MRKPPSLAPQNKPTTGKNHQVALPRKDTSAPPASDRVASQNAAQKRQERIALVLRHFTDLPDEAEVRVGVVAALKGVSVPTVWRWSRQGLLPKPRRRGGTTVWKVGELRQS